MESLPQESSESARYEEPDQQEQAVVQDSRPEFEAAEETHTAEQEEQSEPESKLKDTGNKEDGFVHGLSVGLGIGCIATFIIMWVTVFFTPQLPPSITYENLLAIFIYPLIYLLAVGLVALTAGIVREYYSNKSRTRKSV